MVKIVLGHFRRLKAPLRVPGVLARRQPRDDPALGGFGQGFVLRREHGAAQDGGGQASSRQEAVELSEKFTGEDAVAGLHVGFGTPENPMRSNSMS